MVSIYITIFNMMVIETIKWYLAIPHGDSFHFFPVV